MKLRPVVRVFAEEMERILRANDYKDGWQECSSAYLMMRLKEEVAELELVSNSVMATANDVLKEAADVANFAMMMGDVAMRDVGTIRMGEGPWPYG